MNANKKITVLTVNGRRQVVTVSGSTTILQVLETVCKKHELQSDEFGLKHINRNLDMSQMIRFSGLPNNCNLEMYPLEIKRAAESIVNLCIQLENGERFQDSVVSSTELIDCLKKLCPDQLKEMKNPIVLYMRSEFFGEGLCKTLKEIGINDGRSLIRLVDKQPEELKTQANFSVPLNPIEKPTEDDNKEARKPKQEGGVAFQITKNLIQDIKPSKKDDDRKSPICDPQPSTSKGLTSPKCEKKFTWDQCTGQSISGIVEHKKEESKSMESDDTEEEEDPHIITIGERNAILFSLDSSQKIIEDLPDSFFDLSVHDIKLVLRDLKKIENGSSEDPLLTAKMREAEKQRERNEALQQYKTTIMRIQFPDRLVLQGKFRSTEYVSDIYEFVKKFLSEDFNFHLFTIPPKVIPSPKLSLYDAQFVPKAVVHFGLDDGAKQSGQIKYLKKEYLDKLSTFDAAGRAAQRRNKIADGITGKS